MKLISERGWAIVPQKDGFLFYEPHTDYEEEGFFRCSLGSINKISEDEYCSYKFGEGYKNILKVFDNCVIPNSVTLEDDSVIVAEYKDSIVYKFDSKGNMLWKNETLGDFSNIYDLAYENNNLWCIYPTMNTIKKISLDNLQEQVAISDFENKIFDYPEFASAYNGLLYVCDMGNCRICTVDLTTYEVKEHLKYREPTWEYWRINGEEIVRLESGIYILD